MQSIQPALWIGADLEYDDDIEAPISISGRIMVGNKVVAYINEHQIINETVLDLKVFDKKTADQRMDAGNKFKSEYRAKLTALLSPKAIDFIEECRERHHEKSVDFQIEFIVKTLVLSFKPVGTGGPQNTNSFLELRVAKPYEHYSIKQSDWINRYSEHLGIGRFLLLELNVTNNNVPTFWKDLYQNLIENLRGAENCI